MAFLSQDEKDFLDDLMDRYKAEEDLEDEPEEDEDEDEEE